MVEKAALRKKHKELRKALSSEQRENYSLDIANQALNLDIWKYEYYHIFLPIKKQLEVNTQYLISILQGKDKHVLLSKSNFSTLEMKNYLLTDSTKIITNPIGIPEPEGGIAIDHSNIQVVFVPLLAYDSLGNRIGYGKGFYDRFLAKCRPDALKIGVNYFQPNEVIEDAENTDIRIDELITVRPLKRATS